MTLTSEYQHEPVLLQEVLDALDPVLQRKTRRQLEAASLADEELLSPACVCDCTLGGAGHSLRFAQHMIQSYVQAYYHSCPETNGKDRLEIQQREGISQPLAELNIYKAILELYSTKFQVKPELLMPRLIGIDQDDRALEVAAARLSQACQGRLHQLQAKGNFSELDRILTELCCPGVDFFLFDIGVSSPQFDVPERGFSYRFDAPLDMRMDPRNQSLTAQEIINHYHEADLTRIFREYGEEKFAHRIAQLICRARARKTIETTFELVDLIKQAIPAAARRSGGHPAKRSFQALRIEVNRELEVLKHALEAAVRWLNPQGRIAVISYHSLEDRLVKQIFAQYAQSCICPPDIPVCQCGHTPVIELVNRKPILASEEELVRNPRSQSAKLRIAQKL